jgi:very-short-patch-repair endonuclease
MPRAFPDAIAAWAIQPVRGDGEPEVRRLASLQRGLVEGRQLLAAGIGRGAIRHRVATGRQVSKHPGVYLVGHDAMAPGTMEFAAVLYYGGRAVISHRSAAALWGLGPPGPVVDVTVVGGSARTRPGVRVFRTAGLDLRDLRSRDGIPVTSPARTWIDYGGCSELGEAERALSEVRTRGLARDSELRAAVARCPVRKGTRRARLLLRDDESGFTRSAAERLLRVMVRQAGLAMPIFNAPRGGFEVDAVWSAAKLVVEVDGYAVHGRRTVFERDRLRTQVLAARGFTVIRVTWRQLTTEPMAVIARIAQAIAVGEARAEALAAAVVEGAWM